MNRRIRGNRLFSTLVST